MKKCCFLLLLLFSVCAGKAQKVQADAVVHSPKMRIGEQVAVDLYLTYNANVRNLKVKWPRIGDTLSEKVEVISVSAIDTTFPDKTNSSRIFQHQQIMVSVYDSGFYMVPSFSFVLNDDENNVVYTKPITLEVHTVPTDTSLAKTKDIKPPFDEPFNWKWYIGYLYGGIVIIVLGVLLIYLIRRFSRKQQVQATEPEKPRVPPHITALQSLEKIKEQQVWKEGKDKEYYSAIADTIRLYIEERFMVNALESTSDEIMTAFRSQVVDQESKNKLQQLLMLADLVKFAKMRPIEAEHNFTLQNAFDFVNGTKREDEVQASEFTDESQSQP